MSSKTNVNETTITRKGDSIILPEKMTTETAIGVLQHAQKAEQMEKRIQEIIPVLPWEGAIALTKAVKRVFGVTLEAAGGTEFSIQTGVKSTMKVHWGKYLLPMGGYVQADATRQEGRWVFVLSAVVKGMHEHAVRNLIEKVREIATSESPYRGKAFQLTLTDNDGDRLMIPTIAFLDLPSNPIEVIVRKEIERDFHTCIWGPIRFSDEVRAKGVALRRGILLAGEYGTGKSLTATRTAQLAVENGWTFITLLKSSDLPEALTVARQYEPCVIFVEDIDRLVGIERDDDVNTVLNSLDGVGNKSSEVMVVFTTNHPEDINPAMQRPGRIDSAIHLLPPDGPTAARLIAHYAGDYLAEDQDLSVPGQELAGVIPARIREVVERAKLAVISEGKTEVKLSAEDISYAAGFVRRETDLFKPVKPDSNGHDLNVAMRRFGEGLINATDDDN